MRTIASLCLCVLAACSDDDGDSESAEARQGGDTTIEDRTSAAFGHPAANLTMDQLAVFQTGRGPFNFHWEIPQLGPLFNNDACLACHHQEGRGVSQIGNDSLRSQALIRVSLIDQPAPPFGGAAAGGQAPVVDGTPDVPGGDVPVPGYGLQLQDHATDGLPEVIVAQSWVEHAEAYGDGETVMLRAPKIDARPADGSQLGGDVQMSYRQAPGLIGLGLLEAVPDDALLALADPDDADGDGISGRVNLVWSSLRQATVIGRFGHKATEPSLREQTAAAFANDIGLSNTIFPEPDGMRDVADEQFEQVIFFVSTIGVPAAAPLNAAARRGRTLFHDLGCAGCHTPTLVTGSHEIPQLANQTIHPYTDLLLHDVGDLLTDARRDFVAQGVEWRTPPLWGIGLVQVVEPMASFLHDGRARSLEEAILWHGGEAGPAREGFRLATKQQRDDLIGFLQTL